MFVVTADQIASSRGTDRVPAAFELLADLEPDLALPPDRNAGDELQLVTASAPTALDIVLRLRRDEHWSVGLGVGSVREPLARSARESSGAAFLAARDAVDAAKRAPTRFSLVSAVDGRWNGGHVGALLDLLLALQGRRSPEGWAVVDLLRSGSNQLAAAEALGITPQAVSLRLRAAGWRIEERARPALVLLLEDLDRGMSSPEQN
ncbi:MAG: DNA-binding protein [Naasia sp.]|jgi:hypothetical protein|uniref:DNA-binding protein n=1 Tax=Naasia sp. TaxID=2546198 RepID=UPI0026265126|nr:DNA-binding protein [Naasia sp.]MCU1571248.1 DNA-binding protein [Naasia sp.]